MALRPEGMQHCSPFHPSVVIQLEISNDAHVDGKGTL